MNIKLNVMVTLVFMTCDSYAATATSAQAPKGMLVGEYQGAVSVRVVKSTRVATTLVSSSSKITGRTGEPLALLTTVFRNQSNNVTSACFITTDFNLMQPGDVTNIPFDINYKYSTYSTSVNQTVCDDDIPSFSQNPITLTADKSKGLTVGGTYILRGTVWIYTQ